MEKNDDVVGLLGELKEMAFSAGGVKHPHWTLQEVLRPLLAINQGPKESVANCHKRFLAAAEVTEVQWGLFCPLETAATDSAANKQKAHDQLCAMIFLAGADKMRFEKLVDELNNSCLTGNDNHPESSITKTMRAVALRK